MQSIISPFKRLQAFSFLIGLFFGAFIALSLFSYLVPGGYRTIAMRHAMMPTKQGERNRLAMQQMKESSSDMPMMNHQMSGSNPYMMKAITSESQFLKEMKLHHEAAVVMANQVLKIPSLHSEVTNLAKNIISAQTTEIKMMQDWITSWKY